MSKQPRQPASDDPDLASAGSSKNSSSSKYSSTSSSRDNQTSKALRQIVESGRQSPEGREREFPATRVGNTNSNAANDNAVVLRHNNDGNTFFWPLATFHCSHSYFYGILSVNENR